MADEILRVNRTHFTCFLTPGCHVVILLRKVFFHVAHKRLSERGTTYMYIYFSKFYSKSKIITCPRVAKLIWASRVDRK